ncbi:MAG: bifunctional riboflavin kinase/FAD synthetase [Clostridium sp.]|nr:bifunctional riboflavin kinase/FAD synthetase [Clostridium sp.]
MGAAVAVGMFDGVHLGHQSLVHQLGHFAKERGLEAGIITFSDHPLRLICPDKAPKLLTSPEKKIEYLLQAGADRAVALDFTEELRRLTAREFMREMSERMGIKAWMIGFNHRFGSDGLSDIEDYKRIGKELGIEVERARCEMLEGMDRPVCSSLIRQELILGNICQANAMLGRPYSITGAVEAGRRIGRTIGFPTANVRPKLDNALIPERGAYACIAIIDGKEWKAMTNIGVRPTIGQGLAPTIETHVIGFSGDLYGKEIEVLFLRRLRDERRFASLDELRAQLRCDLQEIQKGI